MAPPLRGGQSAFSAVVVVAGTITSLLHYPAVSLYNAFLIVKVEKLLVNINGEAKSI